MDDSTGPTDHLLRRAADRSAGHPTRRFQAAVAVVRVDPQIHADPELKTDRRDTDRAAREVLARLRADKGYAAADLPSERATRDVLNRIGYRLARVRKARPLEKTAATDAVFANVEAARAAARADPGALEISVDTTAKVAGGPSVRGGRNPDRV